MADEMASVILNGNGRGETQKKWALTEHSSRARGCAKRRRYLINKGWRRKGPGGPTGLQNAFARFSCVM